MIIDSHQHFWIYDPVKDAWITDDMQNIRRNFLPEDLQPLLDEQGIDGCVAVQASQTEDENHFLLSLAGKHDFIKGIVGWVDLCADDLEERLECFRGHPALKGFRHIVQGEPSGFLSRPQFIRGVRKLAHYNFTYDLLIYHHQLKEAIGFVHQVPGVKIVVDHIAKPSIIDNIKDPWNMNMEALAAFENVHCKISGMVTEADWKHWKKEQFVPYLDKIFEVFGSGRVMYGSDWPVCLVAASYQQQYSITETYVSKLSDAEKRQVFGGNAERFYNL